MKDLFDRDLTFSSPALIVFVETEREGGRGMGWQGIEMRFEGVALRKQRFLGINLDLLIFITLGIGIIGIAVSQFAEISIVLSSLFKWCDGPAGSPLIFKEGRGKVWRMGSC